jgi:hypothetical protein
MDLQHVIDIILGLGAAIIGWYVNGNKDDIKAIKKGLEDAQHEREALRLKMATEYRTKAESMQIQNEIVTRLDRIGNLELLLAQQYTTKVDFSDLAKNLGSKLDRIEGKLDGKVDK